MPFCRLEAVDRPHQRRAIPVALPELGRVLLPGCQPRLILANIMLDGIIGQPDLVGVLSRQTQLRHRPMASKTTMTEPAQHVPAQTPARHTDGPCGCGAEGVPPTRARGLRTAHQAVDHLRRPLQRPKMMIAVVAYVHAACTDWARTIRDIQSNPFQYCPRRPTIRHGRSILVLKEVHV